MTQEPDGTGGGGGSRRTDVILGALTAVAGAPALLGGLGVLPMGPGDSTIPLLHERLLSLLFGLVFLSGGAWAMLRRLPGTAARLARGALAFVVAVGLTLVLGWVAIGPGERHFTSPAVLLGARFAEISGRIGFGLVAVMGLLIVILMIRRIARRDPPPKT